MVIYTVQANVTAQGFKNAKQYATFHHPIITAIPPKSPVLSYPEEYVFVILRNDETLSIRLFTEAFAWANENILHYDLETGGRVKRKWDMTVAAVVHPDSTIAYYKVYNGIHRPLEGTAGV